MWRALTFGSILRVANLLATVALSFVMMPFVVRSIGDRMYGLWTLVGAFVTYYGLMDLGLSSAVTRFLSRALGAKDNPESNRVFNNALFLYLGVSGATLVIGAVAALVAPGLLGNDGPLLREVLLICTLTIAFGFPMRVFIGALNAYLRFDRTASVELLSLLLRNGLVCIAVLAGYGIVGLAWANLLAGLPQAALYVYFVRRDLPFLRVDRQQCSRGAVATLFSYSSFTFIAQLADILRFQVDALVVAGFVGVAAVTHYRIAGTMTQYFIEVMTALMGVLSPVFSRQEGTGDYTAIRKTFFLMTRLSVCVSSFIGFGLLAWGRPFIGRWMGAAYLDAYPCLAVLVSGCLFALWQSPSITLLYGTSRHRFLALFNTVEGLTNLALSILLARRYGIVGVALGTAIPMFVIKIFVQPAYTCQVAGIRWLDYASGMGRTLGVVAAALVIPFAVSRSLAVANYRALMATAALSLLAYAPVVWLAAFSAEEKRKLLGVLLHRRESVLMTGDAC